MDHGYFKDRISAYYDNNLKPEERVVIEEHLKECEECRKLLAELAKLDRLVEEHSHSAGMSTGRNRHGKSRRAWVSRRRRR